jgi:hypothetical protein
VQLGDDSETVLWCDPTCGGDAQQRDRDARIEFPFIVGESEKDSDRVGRKLGHRYAR